MRISSTSEGRYGGSGGVQAEARLANSPVIERREAGHRRKSDRAARRRGCPIFKFVCMSGNTAIEAGQTLSTRYNCLAIVSSVLYQARQKLADLMLHIIGEVQGHGHD